jgi:uncharacterized protein (DUF1800 family)
MSDPCGSGTEVQHWAEYEPGAAVPWDRRRVVHLHRRAGFAATWGEIERDLKDGPRSSIDRLLAGEARAGGASTEFEQNAGQLADAAIAARDSSRLKSWWVYRMLFGPDPLGERLALLWHNHFATSNAKVNDLADMWRQNDTFRHLARARFGDLLKAMMRDPALLRWLDADSNRKGRPNENLARELMELFTLGVGRYTETDVKEAARALTGWTVAAGASRDDLAEHDEGDKVILGRRGRWRGDDLVRLLLEHEATPRRLAWRICEMLLGEGATSEAGIQALAAGLRQRDLDLGWAVETVLRSRAFMAPSNLGSHVLGPVEYIVGAARCLELSGPPPSTLLLADWAARLGQDIFFPPNVGGWPGGRGWISPHSMIARTNFAAALVDGRLTRNGRPFDAAALPRRHGRPEDLEGVISFYCELILGAAPGADWRHALVESLGPAHRGSPQSLRTAVALILASPAAQLA